MWGLLHSLRGLAALRRRPAAPQHPVGRRADASTTDWLPPVLDPGDWSLSLTADRSAGWYFERD